MPRAILSHVEADFIQPLWRVARWSAVAALLCGAASAQKPVNQPLLPERRIEPTFLRRHIPDVPAKSLDVSTESCRYKPLFGAGDSDSAVPRGVARFGELTLSPGGNCKAVTLESEEQVYVIIDGAGLLRYGADSAAVRRHDFLYLPAGVERSLSSSPAGPMRLFVMGFKLPEKAAPPPKLLIANYDDVQKQTVGGHPDSVVYQLMMGDVTSKRDRLAAAHVLTSLYVMEFAPGGTN